MVPEKDKAVKATKPKARKLIPEEIESRYQEHLKRVGGK